MDAIHASHAIMAQTMYFRSIVKPHHIAWAWVQL